MRQGQREGVFGETWRQQLKADLLQVAGDKGISVPKNKSFHEASGLVIEAGLDPRDVVHEGPFWQNDLKSKLGFEILLQQDDENLGAMPDEVRLHEGSDWREVRE